jgi:hypothetical protein
MKIKAKLTLLAMVLAMLVAAPMLAATLGALPPAQTQNGVAYVSGGIGEHQQAAMRAAAGRYSLMMTFAERDGDFLNDIKVNIANSGGHTVLDTLSGPMLLVDLPPGQYTVRADFGGETLVRSVDVKRGQNRELAYAWPNNIEKRGEFSAFEPKPGEPSQPPAGATSRP